MDHETPTRQPMHRPEAKADCEKEMHAPVDNAGLRDELSRQRAELLNGPGISLAMEEEPEANADIADQSSADYEQDIAIQVKSRTFEKIRRIEEALRLMRTNQYGCCRACYDPIPVERLKVQPDAVFCVPCLTLLERGTLA